MGLTAKKVYAVLNGKIKKLSGDVSGLGTPLFYAGSVATADLLPLLPNAGAVYNIEQKSIYGEAGTNVAWNGTLWDALGPTFDLSLLLTKENAKNLYLQKNQGSENSGKFLVVGEDGNVIPSDTQDGGVKTDTTLTKSGEAADAKVVGDKITTLNEDLGNSNILYNNILQIKNTINMLNPNELKIGKIIDPNGKVVNGPENRSTSELINVDSSIKLRVTTAFNQTLFQYDNIGNMLAYTNTFNSSNPIDLDTNTKYIRICVWNDTMPFMLYQSDEILSYIDYGKYSENVRELVNIHTSDTEEEIYLKLYDACNKGNCDIYWEYGTYEFSTIFELIKTKYKRATAYELPIGGNCRYFFNGSTVIGTGISSDSNVINNSSIFGTWRKSQSYELYDGIFIANHLIYCVHEEASSSSIPYRTKYHNLRMFHNTVTDDYDTTIGLRKCIGGGTGLHPNIEVSNCYFQTDHGRDIGWHGHKSDDKTTFYINIHNCYFSHGISNDNMSTNETAELIFNGNSTPIIPTTNHNGVKGWKVFAWNNEKRSN